MSTRPARAAMNVPAGAGVSAQINPDRLHLFDQDTEVAV